MSYLLLGYAFGLGLLGGYSLLLARRLRALEREAPEPGPGSGPRLRE